MRKQLSFTALILAIALCAATDARAQWVQINGPIYSSGDFVKCFAVIGSKLFVGTVDGVFLSTDNGSSWDSVNNGLPGGVTAFGVMGTNLFAGTSAGIYRSTDSGGSWTAGGSWPAASYRYYDFYLTSLAVVGTDIFAGGRVDVCGNCNDSVAGVFISTDSGKSWSGTGLFPPSPVWTHVPTIPWVTSLAVIGSNLFAGNGTYIGNVFRSTNKGAVWDIQSINLPQYGGDNGAVSCLAVIGPNLFAGVDGAGVGGIASVNINNSVSAPANFNYNVNAFALSGTNLFAATNVGVFLSTNLGTSWDSLGTSGDVVAEVTAIAVSDSNLFAVAGGLIIWRRPLSEMLPSSAVAEQTTLSPEIQTYPNPLTQSTKISFTLPESGEAEITIVNLLGSEVARLFSGRLSAGEHSFEWDAGQAAAGTYFCALRTINGVQRVAMVVER